MSTAFYRVFDTRAAEYDAWYDGEPGKGIFAMEVECLKPFLQTCPRPHLEIGVGTGRFAAALKVEYGLDPAPGPLRIAASRGIQVVRAVGEKVPFADGSFGGVLLALTLCFVDNPLAVLRETRRILRPDGRLMLGLVPGESPWAKHYLRKGDEGHWIYRGARFYSREQIESLLRLSRFEVVAYRSSLFQRPGQDRYPIETPASGYRPSAGFVAMAADLQRNRCSHC